MIYDLIKSTENRAKMHIVHPILILTSSWINIPYKTSRFWRVKKNVHLLFYDVWSFLPIDFNLLSQVKSLFK